MPEFQYQGVDRAGKRVSGKLNSPSEGDLRMTLRGQGVRPVRISKVGALNVDLGQMLKATGGVSLASLLSFTRQLQVLLSSGIPVVQGLEVLADQSQERSLRSALQAIKERVSSGSYLWEAFSSYPKIFPKIYIALLRAGETSGSVDQMLKRLGKYLEEADRLRKAVKGALLYPVLVILVGIGIITMILVFVIPKFEELLKGSNQSLPGPTLLVMGMSHFVINHFIYLAGGAAFLGFVSLRYVKSEEGRAFLDHALFRAPLFGTLMQKAGVARFARTMQTLLSSGINLIDAIDICKATINNAVLEEAVAKIRMEVESGKTLGLVIARLKVFPNMAVQMISVGESTGNLDKMLEKIADFYEEEVSILVAGLTKLIEPLVLVILGAMVGGMLIAMYLPVFRIAGAVS